MRYCSYCGVQISDTAKFCPSCGKKILPPDQVQEVMQSQAPAPAYSVSQQVDPIQNQYSSYPQDARLEFDTYISKELSAGKLWKVIGIFQILIGIPLAFVGYGVVTIILGIINIRTANAQIDAMNRFRQNPKGISSYASAQTNGILFVLLNLFLGAFIGFIAALKDNAADDYGKQHIQSLQAVERAAAQGNYYVN